MQSTDVQPLKPPGGQILPAVSPQRRNILAAFVLMALVPGLFWVWLSYLLALQMGLEPSTGSLIMTGSGIVLFLGLIFAILRARAV